VLAWIAFFYCFVAGARFARPAGDVTTRTMVLVLAAAIGIAAPSASQIHALLIATFRPADVILTLRPDVSCAAGTCYNESDA